MGKNLRRTQSKSLARNKNELGICVNESQVIYGDLVIE